MRGKLHRIQPYSVLRVGHGGTIGTHNFAATLQPKLIHASLPRHLSKKLEVVEGCSGDLRSQPTRAKQEAGFGADLPESMVFAAFAKEPPLF